MANLKKTLPKANPLVRLYCLSKKADIPDLSHLSPHDLGTVVVGNLYVLRSVIESLNPTKEDVYDMQVAENKIRQAVMQISSYFEDSTGGKGGNRKAKRRIRKDKND